MDAREIPFTPSQRSTIRATGLLMAPSGLFLLMSGGRGLSRMSMELAFKLGWPFTLAWSYSVIEVLLGLGLVSSGAILVSVSARGTVRGLLRALRVLCLVMGIKAALLLAFVGVLAFAMLGGPLLLH